MLEIVRDATKIIFSPKDDNAGISRNMLFKISKLSEKHGCTLHLYESFSREISLRYYTWTPERILPNSEIKQIVDGIRDICKGVEIQFDISVTRSVKEQTINIEEIDSLSKSTL